MHSLYYVKYNQRYTNDDLPSKAKVFSSFTFDWFYPTLWRGCECVNLTIYDPTIVINIVRWSGNDKFGAPSLFCFSHPPSPPSPPNSVVDTDAKTEFDQQYGPLELKTILISVQEYLCVGFFSRLDSHLIATKTIPNQQQYNKNIPASKSIKRLVLAMKGANPFQIAS